jgi:hypothetical protein
LFDLCQLAFVAKTHKTEVVTPPAQQECDGIHQEAEMLVPPTRDTEWFKALAGVEREFDTANAVETRPPRETGWFKALKGAEQEYDNFKVDHRF